MTWQKSLILAAAVGLSMEGLEVVFRVGIFDIDDVILNAFGVMIGYWVFAIFVKRMQPRLRSSWISAALLDPDCREEDVYHKGVKTKVCLWM